MEKLLRGAPTGLNHTEGCLRNSDPALIPLHHASSPCPLICTNVHISRGSQTTIVGLVYSSDERLCPGILASGFDVSLLFRYANNPNLSISGGP